LQGAREACEGREKTRGTGLSQKKHEKPIGVTVARIIGKGEEGILW